MFLLAHMGFTAAPGAAAARWWGGRRGFADGAPDMRWLLAGSVLPDLVDKALGQVFLKSYFQNGRIFCHTGVFALAMFAAGVYRLRRKDDGRVLLMAWGVAGHLVLDLMWQEPVTFLWPALGPFARNPSMRSLIEQIAGYLGDPVFWATEAGGALTLLLALRLLGIESPAGLKAFLGRGLSPSLVPGEAAR